MLLSPSPKEQVETLAGIENLPTSTGAGAVSTKCWNSTDSIIATSLACSGDIGSFATLAAASARCSSIGIMLGGASSGMRSQRSDATGLASEPSCSPDVELKESERVGIVLLDDSSVVTERTLVPVPVLAVGLLVLTAGINEPVAMDAALVRERWRTNEWC